MYIVFSENIVHSGPSLDRFKLSSLGVLNSDKSGTFTYFSILK